MHRLLDRLAHDGTSRFSIAPMPAVTTVATASTGLRVDARSLGSAGRSAMGLAVLGFVVLCATMPGSYARVLR